MKKGLAIIAIVAVAVVVYFVFFNKTAKQSAEPKQQPLTISNNTDAFNKPFNEMLNTYYGLKDALVNWDSVTAAKTAATLTSLANKLPFDALKGDTSIIVTAQSFAGTVSAESKGLAGEPTIEGQRRSFYTLSENLYNLIRTVHYDGAVIYHNKCPMAFGESEEAYWLSNSPQIINPYLGNKHPKYHSAMITCGNVEDSIDFRKK